MSDTPDWTAVLSGPIGRRASLLAALHQDGIEVDWPAEMHHAHSLPDTTTGEADPTVGWILARTPDINSLAGHLERAEWALRMHWPTPRCLACYGHGQLNGEPCLHCSGRGRTPVPFTGEQE